MTQDKIQKLIDRENERREEDMIEQARQLINAITQEQECVEEHQANIVELRKKLQSLETKPLNSTSIIG